MKTRPQITVLKQVNCMVYKVYPNKCEEGGGGDLYNVHH
jgi:hypothetical protein